LLPCNVTVSQLDVETVEVSMVDPLVMLGGVANANFKPIAEEVAFA
jgi:hypothetical protein